MYFIVKIERGNIDLWARPSPHGDGTFREGWVPERDRARRFSSWQEAKSMSFSIMENCKRTIYRIADQLEQLAGQPAEEVVFEDSWGEWE